MGAEALPRGARPYLRFVVGADFDRPRRLAGPFQSPFCPDADTLTLALSQGERGAEAVPEWYRAELTEAFAWFCENLAVPPFRRHRRWGRAVCWFRSDAGEPLERMWDLAILLRQIDVPVRLLRSHEPGQVLWADEHQIVARK